MVELASVIEDFGHLKIKIRYRDDRPNIEAREDVRSPTRHPLSVPRALVAPGNGLLAAGSAVATWAQAVNRLFEPGLPLQRAQASASPLPALTPSSAIPVRDRDDRRRHWAGAQVLAGRSSRRFSRGHCSSCARAGRTLACSLGLRALPIIRIASGPDWSRACDNATRWNLGIAWWFRL
jgi:hypothetical protein